MTDIYTVSSDPGNISMANAWVGDWHSYALKLVDDNDTTVDITSATLSATYTNINTETPYSWTGGTAAITKQYAARGIVSILNPSAYPTTGTVRLTITATVGANVERYGPLLITVLQP